MAYQQISSSGNEVFHKIASSRSAMAWVLAAAGIWE